MITWEDVKRVRAEVAREVIAEAHMRQLPVMVRLLDGRSRVGIPQVSQLFATWIGDIGAGPSAFHLMGMNWHEDDENQENEPVLMRNVVDAEIIEGEFCA